MTNQYVIIVAGGKGERMGGNLPKQFLPLQGKPVLMHTVERFAQTLPSAELIVVLPKNQIDFWKELCHKHQFWTPHQVAEGGETRFDSVKNGLALTDRKGVIGIHDGVRPFVSPEVIIRSFEQAKTGCPIVPVVELTDSIRRVTEDCNFAVPRSEFRLIQTPQVFPATLIHNAYKQPFDPYFTDDASVVEALGHEIVLIDGNRENIKLTTPLDLLIGKAIIESKV